MKTRNLTPKLVTYLQTHFSIVGFVDGLPINTARGIVNRCGPNGLEVNRKWYDWEATRAMLVVA